MWKGCKFIAAALFCLLAVSCAGVNRPALMPAETRTVPTEETRSQPKSEQPASNQEVLVHGSSSDIISSLEPDKDVNVEFILDASGSMLNTVGGKTKIGIAKEAISSLVQELPSSVNVGLRVYGHRVPLSDKARSCQDIQLLAPLRQDNSRALIAQLQGVAANGWTPIAKSLELAAQDVSDRLPQINNIVLVSDGQETCDGHPIEVANRLKDVSGLTVHTIGFAIDDDTRKELREIARVSGGTYNEAEDATGLLQAIDRALVAARSGTFLRGEVIGDGGRQVSASLWLQDPQTGSKLHEFRSWINAPAAPGLYNILVGTAPRISYRGFRIEAHTKTIIRVSTGEIRVDLADVQGNPIRAPVYLKDQATGSMLRSFSTWYNQPVLPGSYDLTVEANPTIVRSGVSISTQKLTAVNLRSGSLRVDVVGLGGERPNWELELYDPGSAEVAYRSMVGREQSIMAGVYRLAILSVPVISKEVHIGPGEAKLIRIVTGILGVELLDSSGQKVKALVSLVGDAQGISSNFYTWENAFPPLGIYQLTILSQPEIRRQVQISTTDPTILRLRLP